MAAPILLTGGTGTLGRLVLSRLRAAGHDVRVLSRTQHEPADGVSYVVGDLTTGEGLVPAVDGVETLVHLAGTAKGDEVKTRHLVEAVARAGRPRLTYISVVGADRVPVQSSIDRAAFGYFAAKRAADGGVDAKIGRTACDDQLLDLQSLEQRSEIGAEECVAGRLPDDPVLRLDAQSGMQLVTGLRGVKRIAFGSAMLDEDDRNRLGAEAARKRVDASHEAVGIVTRRGEQALLHVHDKKCLPVRHLPHSSASDCGASLPDPPPNSCFFASSRNQAYRRATNASFSKRRSLLRRRHDDTDPTFVADEA